VEATIRSVGGKRKWEVEKKYKRRWLKGESARENGEKTISRLRKWERAEGKKPKSKMDQEKESGVFLRT